MKGYVINLDRAPERLMHFYKQSGSEIFERIPAIDKKILELIGNKEFFFDTLTFAQIVQRDVTMGEIACSLSHIRCWAKIESDETIQDNEFSLIAEDDIILCPTNSNTKSSFISAVIEITNFLKESEIEIVKLQNLFCLPEDLYRCSNHISLQRIKGNASYDSSGSSLYLIRKRLVREIMNKLQTIKPFWLADDFSQFCPQNKIVMSQPVLGYISEHFPSDLESERQIERTKPR